MLLDRGGWREGEHIGSYLPMSISYMMVRDQTLTQPNMETSDQTLTHPLHTIASTVLAKLGI